MRSDHIDVTPHSGVPHRSGAIKRDVLVSTAAPPFTCPLGVQSVFILCSFGVISSVRRCSLSVSLSQKCSKPRFMRTVVAQPQTWSYGSNYDGVEWVINTIYRQYVKG